MDHEYIRYLMLYSDKKFPFEKAKSDPGLTDSENNINRYIEKNGNTRKFENQIAKKILFEEEHGKKQFLLHRNDYEKLFEREKMEQSPNNLNRNVNELEKEIESLKALLKNKEAELNNHLSNKQSSPPPVWGQILPKQQLQSNDDGIIERKLKDTGYTDKINN